MKILVIGSGGREHSIIKACLSSTKSKSVIASPGNGGINQEVPCFPINVENIEELVNLAKKERVDFVIVGPEVPLALGLVDALQAEGILAYGPNKKAAQLEASKSFCKDFLKKYNIPTAHYESFTNSDAALKYVNKCSLPVVIKASGLAAGKGVIIATTQEEAQQAVRSMLDEKAFGESGETVVIEDYLEGEEASIIAVVSGEDYCLLPPSQDHKRIGEKDTGPNTGGMGAYAPADVITENLEQIIKEKIIHPTLAGFISEEIDFRGTLYIGLMLTKNGPQVLEFNVRFGDPETQVLLPLLETDLIELLYACASGNLKDFDLKLKSGYAITVVQAAEGYPGTYRKGDLITLPNNLPQNTQIIHAGTKRLDNGDIVTNGGRVLSITGLGQTLEEASQKAYQVCEHVHFKGNYYRKDIGAKQLKKALAPL